MPTNRGRGNDRTETITISEPAFLRGDINSDGVVDRNDAKLAVKGLFKPENFDCPATADIGIFPQGAGSDGYFTAEDVYLWNKFKQGKHEIQHELICAKDCAIVNHMDPKQ